MLSWTDCSYLFRRSRVSINLDAFVLPAARVDLHLQHHLTPHISLDEELERGQVRRHANLVDEHRILAGEHVRDGLSIVGRMYLESKLQFLFFMLSGIILFLTWV